MNEEKKKRYAELLKQEQQAEEKRRIEAERKAEERQRLDELMALQQQGKKGELAAIVKQFGEGTLPPSPPEDQPQQWPGGADESQNHSLFVDQESLTDEQINQIRENMTDHYPSHCELHEYITVSGKRAAMIVGVTAEEATALQNMMTEKRKLESSLGQTLSDLDQERIAPPGLKTKIASALDRDVAPPALETEYIPSPTPKQAGQKVTQRV